MGTLGTHLLHELRSLQEPAKGSLDVDARALVLLSAAYLMMIASVDRHSIARLIPLAAVPLGLAQLAQLKLVALARKVLWVMPLLLMVGLFDPLLQPQVVWQMGPLAVSAGWLSLGSLLLRGALCVAMAGALLAAVGGLDRFAAALYALRLPAGLAVQLMLLQRYAVILVEDLTLLQQSRRLRGGAGTLKLREYGSMLGHLLLRSMERATRIHQAMLSRGGAAGLLPGLQRRWSRSDTWVLGGTLGLLACLRWLDLPEMVGRGLLRLAS